MTLPQLVAFASTKANFQTLEDYVAFYERYATFAVASNVQAVQPGVPCRQLAASGSRQVLTPLPS